jgi:hypothetical protein
MNTNNSLLEVGEQTRSSNEDSFESEDISPDSRKNRGLLGKNEEFF